ncbi:MAG: YceD family protein [Ilumatobacteraceae bacterium]
MTRAAADRRRENGAVTGHPALRVNALELARVPGSRRSVTASIPLDALEIDDPRLSDDVDVDVTLESTIDDIDVRGELTVAWSDECRRCLRPLSEVLRIPIDERYAEPGEGGTTTWTDPDDRIDLDTFPIANGQIDLRSMVREGVLLGVLEAPLCRDDCEGLCPTCGTDLAGGPCGCEPAIGDERWAVLDQLREP